jgi:tRNA (pseudouridine54-N1)-methyltransferase
MREFIYFSSKARTSGNWQDLMQAGRMDIACHVVINSFFLSHRLREDVKLHLIFYGPPDPPKHLEMLPKKVVEGTGRQAGKEGIDISKKDVAGLIKKMLYKYKPGRKNEIAQGYWIEKKSLFSVIEDLATEGKKVYILDEKGEDIRTLDIDENPVFLLGDHEGLPRKELKRLKKMCIPVSVGNNTYFASQVITIVSNELDRRGFN